jgi:ATP:corrinoid adenosyltransferase
LALHCRIPETGDVLDLLDTIPEEMDVVLIGRYGPKKLICRVDFLNEVKDLKQPREMVTTEGIQY